jgi:hypothetical protein
MHNGLKNLQSAARSASRRERLEQGQSIHGYDDDSGISGIGLTPVDDLDASYSSPESSQHSGGSHHSHHNYAMQQMTIPYGSGNGGYSSSYSSSSSAAATHGGYGMHPHHHSQDSSPYMGNGQRLPSVDMGIEAIINRPGHHGHHGHGHGI